jgi:HD superfamily phosphohydrolase
VAPLEQQLIPLAALLHDIGHYPFSHALEELEEDRIAGHHEALVGRFLRDPDVASALNEISADAAERIERLIRGASESPLQGLVSGSLDLDKIEYLKRDARFCGVPYGEVDVDRLLHALVLVQDPSTQRLEVGVHEKGIASLESLLFAKYQMFRNVYWHHAVRAATVMYKRIVLDALESELLTSEELVGQTDEGLLSLLSARLEERTTATAPSIAGNLAALRARQLPKRAAEIPAAEVAVDADEWLALDSPTKRAVEERLSAELGLPAGAVFLDFPEKVQMFHLNLLVRRRGGEVQRLGPPGHEGLIGLPRVADELYRTARVLRLFTVHERRTVAPRVLDGLARLTEAEARQLLAGDRSLLAL